MEVVVHHIVAVVVVHIVEAAVAVAAAEVVDQTAAVVGHTGHTEANCLAVVVAAAAVAAAVVGSIQADSSFVRHPGCNCLQFFPLQSFL